MTRLRRPSAALVIALALPLAAFSGGCSDRPTEPTPIVQPPSPPPPAPPPPEPPPPPPRLGVARILAFGDSMTEGTTSPPPTIWRFALDPGLSRSYPFKLQALLSARYTAQTISVFNAGLAGRRAADDLDRFNGAVSEAGPEVILLMEGANDLNAPLRNQGVNDRIRETVAAMEDMVRSATGRQIPVLLATLPPQRPGGPKAGAADFLTRYNDALKAMAAAKGASVVDIFAGFPLSDIGQDGLHPTEAGYERIAGIWLEALKSRYETAPPATRSAAGDGEQHAIEPAGALQRPSALRHD